VQIGEFIGLDVETLGNMGEVYPEFKVDVAELLKKAFVHVKKMRLMKELLEFASGPGPASDGDFDGWIEYGLYYIIDGVKIRMTLAEVEKFDRYLNVYSLWTIISDEFWK
jgi:hypothetical protein